MGYITNIRQSFSWIAGYLSARRVPTRLQYQTTECGVAALAMILSYHGRHVPMEDIRRVTGVSRDCLNAGDMVRTGRHYGFECAAYSREVDDLRHMDFPFVAHLNFIHFVVVEGMSPDLVFVNDPACGRSEIPLEQFNETFTGIVITFSPGPDFVPGGHEKRLFQDLWRRIDSDVKGRFALAFAAACLSPLSLVSLAHILGDGAGLALSAIAAMAGLLLIRGAFGFAQAIALESACYRMSTRHTTGFLRTLFDRPFAYLNYRLPSEQVKSVYDADRIASLICREILPAFLKLPGIVIFLTALFLLDPALGGIAATTILFNIACLTTLSFWRTGERRKCALGNDTDFRSVLGMISSIENDKVAGMDRDFIAGGMGKQAARAVLEQRDAVVCIALHAASRAMGCATLFAPMIVAGGIFRAGLIDLSGVVVAVFLSCALTLAIRDWPQLRGKIDELHLALLRQDDLNLECPVTDEGVLAEVTDRDSPLRFDGVVFGHSPTRPPLLNGIDFAFLRDAEQVGITGPSGGGKSTFASVAAGLHVPWTGTVETSERVMWIDKSPFLFEGSVRENLLLWRDDMDDAILARAVKDACLDEVIAARPGGLNAPVLARGRNFSGGQRQRLEIARALTFNPSVLILDEALDALNPALEEKLRANLRARGSALIIVSHRASTLAACDRVLRFDDGRLTEPTGNNAAHRQTAYMQIETVTGLIKAEDQVAHNQTAVPTRVSDCYTRTVRFQLRQHWQQPHLPLLARRRGTDDIVRLIPAPAGYRIEGNTERPLPENLETNMQCVYESADLCVQSPGVLLRNWRRIASPEVNRANLLTIYLSAAVIALAFFSSLSFLTTDAPPTWKLWLSLGGCLLLVGVLDSGRRLSALRAEHRVRVASYNDLLQRLISTRPGFFRRTSPSELGRMLAGWYRLQKLMYAQTLTNAADIIVVVAGCMSLGWLDVPLGLAGVAMSALWIGGCWWIVSCAIDAQLRRDDQGQAGRRFLLDVMRGIARLRIVGAEVRAATHWRRMFVQKCDYSVRFERIMAIRREIGDIWFWTAMGAIALLVMTIGATTEDARYAAAVLLLAWMTFTSTMRVGDSMADARLACGSLTHVRRLLAAPMEQTGTSPAASSAITLDNVAFNYHGSDSAVLEEVCLKITPGSFVALVGPSGSGKSTLLRLLLNFEEPSAGQILLGDPALQDTDIASWRRGIGVVQQDGQIDSATTIRSIISGLADVNLDAVWHAADLALLGDDIRAMPMGMQTIVEHGKLSTGQEQRLLIAQQVLRRPHLLILDEATNAIPEAHQARLFQNLRAAGIGCILATHRESAIAAADRVFVMDRGRIVWEGSPTAFAKSNAFTDMVRRERLVENDA